MSQGRALFSNRQDKRFPAGVRVTPSPNLLTSTLAPAAPAAPFVSEQTAGWPYRRPWHIRDTSRGTPKTLTGDDTFAPSQSEFSFQVQKKRINPVLGFRNSALLQPVTANPFISEEISPRVLRRNTTYSETSGETPKPLIPDAVHAFKPAPFHSVVRKGEYPTQSGRNVPLLQPPTAPPFAIPPTLLTPRVIPSRDTSQSSPLALLSFDPGPPVFTRQGWPAPIEYRFLTQRSWDAQAFPENIPPAPPPPVRIEIGGATPRKRDRKSPKEEIGELVDGQIAALQKAPEPVADLPKALKPAGRVIQLPRYEPPIDAIPLDIPPQIEEEDDAKIIQMLMDMDLF